jgi:quercetin dioxygenase-like cupin family protein
MAAFMAAWGLAQAHDGHAPATQGGRTILQRQPLPDAPGRHGVMLTVDYAPGEASPAHRHPGSVFAYVLGDDCVAERAEHGLAGARRCVYRIRPVR